MENTEKQEMAHTIFSLLENYSLKVDEMRSLSHEVTKMSNHLTGNNKIVSEIATDKEKESFIPILEQFSNLNKKLSEIMVTIWNDINIIKDIIG